MIPGQSETPERRTFSHDSWYLPLQCCALGVSIDCLFKRSGSTCLHAIIVMGLAPLIGAALSRLGSSVEISVLDDSTVIRDGLGRGGDCQRGEEEGQVGPGTHFEE